jgi:hypothetical protein
MRTISFSKDTYRGEIRTSDLICPAYGNNYLDIAFTQESEKIPSNVVLKSSNISFSLPVRYSQLATEQLDGAFFNLEWLKYYAPAHGTKAIELSVYADDTLITKVNYQLTAGREEIELPTRTFTINGRTMNERDFFRVAPTQRTNHWSNVEMLANYDTANYLLVYMGNGHTETEINTNGIIEVSHIEEGTHVDRFELILVDNANNDNDVVFSMLIKENYCADIELRITNRHGLRGCIGGKIIDSSEGGDDVKSNFGTITPYNGIHRHEKIGQKIQKEVYFDCEGDADLLGLLRDACVYGVCEWYDERTAQWLPCEVADSSLDTDPFKEQSITLILQQL